MCRHRFASAFVRPQAFNGEAESLGGPKSATRQRRCSWMVSGGAFRGRVGCSGRVDGRVVGVLLEMDDVKMEMAIVLRMHGRALGLCVSLFNYLTRIFVANGSEPDRDPFYR
jgi:hypothetical protein